MTSARADLIQRCLARATDMRQQQRECARYARWMLSKAGQKKRRAWIGTPAGSAADARFYMAEAAFFESLARALRAK